MVLAAGVVGALGGLDLPGGIQEKAEDPANPSPDGTPKLTHSHRYCAFFDHDPSMSLQTGVSSKLVVVSVGVIRLRRASCSGRTCEEDRRNSVLRNRGHSNATVDWALRPRSLSNEATRPPSVVI